MSSEIYCTPDWKVVRERVLARDSHRCVLASLLGGECSGRLDVHHIVPLSSGGEAYADENLLCLCSAHHPQVEALRRALLRKRNCRIRHPYRIGREECERRNGTVHLAA